MSALCLFTGFALYTDSASAQSVEELRNLSIEDLSNIRISSVSKTTERLSDAPAAIYVISHDDIMLSGARSIPEMLRLAPNLEVAQLSPTSYAISARGFNVGDNASLSNKLLVLIDGRSVYTPLFGGVYWDMQQVDAEDIDRIEVISGPGATLWGANAVNGVINIITRKSADTQGGVLDLAGGNLEHGASLQYGGRLDQDLTYRVHVADFDESAYKKPGGLNADDGWSKPSGGFRLDWTPPGDQVSVQGDLYTAMEDPNDVISGRDLVASWRHQLDGDSSVQVQAYYDKASRTTQDQGGGFEIDTYDLEAQHNFSLGGWNTIVWGAGERAFSYRFQNTALQLVPATRTLNLANLFAQDTISLTDTVKLTLGMKLEDEPYAGIEPMPSVRGSWKISDSVLLWGAISRAVRSPTPVDDDLREYLGSIDFLNGSPNFKPEVMTAYEAGSRIQAAPGLSFSASSYYNVYNDLRSLEVSPTGSFLPLTWGNLLTGNVYGVEFWGSYRVTGWWRLAAGFNVQHEALHYLHGSSQLGGLALTSDDPNHQASLRSSIDLGHGVTWDADLRYVGRLQHPVVADYGELNTRIGWKVTPTLELSVAGSNLLHPHHIEFIEPPESDQIPRSFLVETRWRF